MIDELKDEREAILSFVDRMRESVPRARLYFAELIDSDDVQTLRLGIELPESIKPTSEQALSLHDLAETASETGKFPIVLTFSCYPKGMDLVPVSLPLGYSSQEMNLIYEPYMEKRAKKKNEEARLVKIQDSRKSLDIMQLPLHRRILVLVRDTVTDLRFVVYGLIIVVFILIQILFSRSLH